MTNQPETDATEDRRNRYANAIRDKVRIRLGSSVAALAAQGRPLKMTLTEAKPAADAAMAVADAEHAELRAELDDLRLKSERMRHELEVMYGGAFDSTALDPQEQP